MKHAHLLALLAAVALLVVRPWMAFGAYDPPGTYTYAKATSTPQAGALIKSGAGVFGGGVAWNASGGAAFLMCFDATSQPTTGTAPIWGSVSCASASFCAMSAIPPSGIRTTTGIYCAFSSTGPNYTQAAGASTGFYSFAYQ